MAHVNLLWPSLSKVIEIFFECGGVTFKAVGLGVKDGKVRREVEA